MSHEGADMHAAGADGAVGGRALTGAAPAGTCVAHRIRDAGCHSTQPNTQAHASSPRRATQDQAKGCAGFPQAAVCQRQVMTGQRPSRLNASELDRRRSQFDDPKRKFSLWEAAICRTSRAPLLQPLTCVNAAAGRWSSVNK